MFTEFSQKPRVIEADITRIEFTTEWQGMHQMHTFTPYSTIKERYLASVQSRNLLKLLEKDQLTVKSVRIHFRERRCIDEGDILPEITETAYTSAGDNTADLVRKTGLLDLLNLYVDYNQTRPPRFSMALFMRYKETMLDGGYLVSNFEIKCEQLTYERVEQI